MNVSELLEKRAKENPDKTAVIFRGQKISFNRLKENAFRLTNSFINLGVKKGDKVAIYLPNCPEYIFSYLAIWSMGGVAVPLDFMLTEEELASCISHSEAVVLIAKSKTGISLYNLKQKCPTLKNIIVCHEVTVQPLEAFCHCEERQRRSNHVFEIASLPSVARNDDETLSRAELLRHENIEPFLCFEELIALAKDVPLEIEIQDRDYAIIFYTSGTTGSPKGVLINYLQLGAPPQSMAFFVNSDLTSKDTVLCALPFSHLGGLIYITNTLVFGLRLVLMERFIPLEFLKNVSHYKANAFWLVPSMYYALLQLKEFEAFDLSSLRWLVTFGASNSADALRRFHQYCPNAHLLNGWGLTETNAPTTVLAFGSSKIESVGRPAPWIEVKIFDDFDKELTQGNVGEIAVKSWVVTDGYLKDAALTAAAIRNGWFYTGDLGKFDDKGDLYIVGRKKEMLKVGGEIVFEPEIENALHKHPDVIEAAVIGIPDKLRGEVPKAYIVLKENSRTLEEDLRQFCRKHLAHFKIPHYFELVSSLPKNRSGKIDKGSLKAQLSQNI
ncbi:MAG: class I adenylate-forming enzyme family protein [Candidatus Omnitrophota bacterium]|nr:class I adenylate-forming enzyme family protein [Candidatus Omnitrophota bacterium]